MVNENTPATETVKAPTSAQKAAGAATDTAKAGFSKAKDFLISDVPRDEKLLSALGYIGFLCVLPLALRPQSEFCQFHGKQALVIAVTFLVLSPLLFFMPAILVATVGLLQIVLVVAGFVSAFGGKKVRFPVIAQIGEKLAF